jgi:hypothetical protein
MYSCIVVFQGIMGDMEHTSEGFYEDDEPVEKIRAAFDAGVKGVTARGSSGRTQYLIIPDLVVAQFVLTLSDEATSVASR